ncbi:MAG: four helix bundle protein [bacterium]
MNKDDLKDRTKKFALEIIKLVETFPKNNVGFVIGKQLIRSATSVGANYRSACRAKSRADFIAKLSIVEEESDETIYWLEIVLDANLADFEKTKKLLKESNELTAIFTKSKITAKTKERK